MWKVMEGKGIREKRVARNGKRRLENSPLCHDRESASEGCLAISTAAMEKF
jgi:hypothetical protein